MSTVTEIAQHKNLLVLGSVPIEFALGGSISLAALVVASSYRQRSRRPSRNVVTRDTPFISTAFGDHA